MNTYWGMPRRPRLYMPGMTYHLTSRTVGKEHWYDEALRDRIVLIIAESLRLTDTELCAFVVMSNHYHLIVRQREEPLGVLMQAIGRRVAVRINYVHKREGRALERPYHIKACLDAEHLRRAIWYIHQNPPAAGMCASPEQYPWSSYYAYAGTSSALVGRRTKLPALSAALRIFASQSDSTEDQLVRDYAGYAAWCNECRAFPETGVHVPRPPVLAGDINWEDYNYGGEVGPRREQPDLRDFAQRVLRELAPDLALESLRFRRHGQVAHVRNELIRRLVSSGYRQMAIARTVGVSEATVSNISRTTPLHLGDMA